MEAIKFEKIVSVNSEIQGHKAQNILEGEISPKKSWLCEKGKDKAILILQLERPVVLASFNVGNAHSAFIEVLVGKAANESDEFETLIPMSTLMNPRESKSGDNPNRTRFFNKPDFIESTAKKAWDRIKIVCTQPFNKFVSYGLCFVEVRGEKDGKKTELPPIIKKPESEDIEIGSFFKKKRISDTEKLAESDTQPSVSEQIKQVEKDPEKHTPISVSKIKTKMSEKLCSEKKPKERKKDETAEEKRKKEEKSKKEEKTPKKRKLEESPKKIEKKKKEKEKKPFRRLMEDVVIVISGYQNPLRSQIRSKALEMGAKYTGDWQPNSTHLVCAFANTPKFNQVKGKGKIVKKDWIEKCYSDRKRYPWRKYALDKNDLKKPESEDEIEAGEESDTDIEGGDGDGPSTSKTPTKKKRHIEEKSKTDYVEEYDLPTDEEEGKDQEDTTDYPMPYLPNILTSMAFYVDSKLKDRYTIERYIVAYDGTLTETFDKNVEFYITDTGGPLIDSFRSKAPKMVAVKSTWLLKIIEKQEMVPYSDFVIK